MRVTPMDGRHGTREEPARGSWLREAWRGLVPIGVATGLVVVIGGGFDVLERRYGAEKSRSAKAASDAERTVPRFAVGVVADGSALVVRDTGTGADTGPPVAPPPGRRFTAVESAPDGTYIAASSGGGTVTFQRLRLDDDGRPEELAPLAARLRAGSSPAPRPVLAVSPDGDRLAYTEGRGHLDVLTLSTGSHKRWPTALTGGIGDLSWSGDTLAFVWTGSSGGKAQLRTIDAGGPAGDLEHSKAVLKIPSGAHTAILRPDGTTIVAALVRGAQLTLQTYASTGEPGQILWKHPIQGQPTVTALDPSDDGALIALAGDLHTRDGDPLPGKDLADVAW
ncbi:WD40 repeat domain-containing protein [Actinomadura algeriensis]|uniref:WD40 repeat protein n=1 Tax=Actinomadura algeriensis TaxID=1679523 RepID=A0ABR9JQQ1_9ACTN|nr:hypothetical protein [Actinomadura algeriensis]MBE1532898.1 WD40 repeat protein [Actinomadura algeriensis]